MSAATGENVEQMFQVLTKSIKDKPKDKAPLPLAVLSEHRKALPAYKVVLLGSSGKLMLTI